MEIKNQDQQDSGLNSTGELNLYLDLLAFSELSQEEQLAYKERMKVVSPEKVLETAEEFPGFAEAADPLEALSPSNETSEPLLESSPDCEQPSVVEAADKPLPHEEAEQPASHVSTTDLFKASGPLSITGFLFDPTSEGATPIVSLAICPSCGSEADSGDLFCVECGAFMVDEKAETEVIGSACDDCGLIIATGELICPACGAVSMVC